jgi:hypothetical protein
MASGRQPNAREEPGVTEVSPQEWGNRYRAIRGTCESLTARLRAEIQVRTALQHAWSAVNHKLDYKSPTEVPRELRRRLFRLSALFELADEQFSELRDARARIASEYAEDVREGQLDLPLDQSSLIAYMQDPGRRAIIARMVSESGGTILEPDDKRLVRDRRDLLRLLASLGITTIAHLDSYLTKEIFPVPLAGTAMFAGDGAGIEDALTLLIMADKGVAKDVYGKVYSGDWDVFSAKTQGWHGRKRQRATRRGRAGSAATG